MPGVTLFHSANESFTMVGLICRLLLGPIINTFLRFEFHVTAPFIGYCNHFTIFLVVARLAFHAYERWSTFCGAT